MSIVSSLLAEIVKSLEYRIGGLNKNVTTHVMDDQHGSEKFCWKLDVE